MNKGVKATAKTSGPLEVKETGLMERFLRKVSKYSKMEVKGGTKSSSRISSTRFRLFSHLMDDFKAGRAIFTKQGFAAFKTFITGAPNLDKEGITYVIERGLVKNAAENGWSLLDFSKEVKHRLKHLKNGVKTSKVWSGITEEMSEETALRIFKEGFHQEYVETVAKSTRPWSERLKDFWKDPRYSWRLWTQGFATSHTLMMPMKLIGDIKVMGWKGFTNFFIKNGKVYSEVNQVIAKSLQHSAEEFKMFDEMIENMTKYMLKHPEKVASNFGKLDKNGKVIKQTTTTAVGETREVFENEMEFFLAMLKKYGDALDAEARQIRTRVLSKVRDLGGDEKAITELVMAEAQRAGIKNEHIISQIMSPEGPKHYQMFLMNLEDMSRFNYGSVKQFRPVFNDQKHLIDYMEPVEHIAQLEYFMNKLSPTHHMGQTVDLTLGEDFALIREDMAHILNSQPSEKLQTALKIFDDTYYATFEVID